MINSAGPQVWLHYQDEELGSTAERLGMQLRQDVNVAEMGNFRWLTVVAPANRPKSC
jgi:hypothetical protein